MKFYLTEKPEGPINVDLRLAKGRTALYLASINGHLEIVRLLVRLGRADPSIKENKGFSPLYVAAQKGHLVRRHQNARKSFLPYPCSF